MNTHMRARTHNALRTHARAHARAPYALRQRTHTQVECATSDGETGTHCGGVFHVEAGSAMAHSGFSHNSFDETFSTIK